MQKIKRQVKYFSKPAIWCLISLLFLTGRFPHSQDFNSLLFGGGYNACLSSSSVDVNFNELDLHYRTLADMVNEICAMDLSDSPRKTAWKYVMEHTHGGQWLLTNSNWQHHPEILINSVGFGWCDDRASVLAALWKEMGYESRVWSLEGHVVPEVNEGSGWEMYDPDGNCYYTDKNDSVVSYQDLITDAPLFLKSYHPKNAVKYLFEGGNFNLPSKKIYEEWMRTYYTTEKDNADVTEWHLSYPKNISGKIVLPRLSKLDFIQLDTFHFEDGLPVKNLIKITLLPGAMGILYLPLVPIGCEGDFRYEKSAQNFSVTGISAFNYDRFPIDSFIVKEVHNTSAVYFLANGIKPTGACATNLMQTTYNDLKPLIGIVGNSEPYRPAPRISKESINRR